MRPLISKLTPSKGFSHTVYLLFNLLLPLLILSLVKADFVPFAVVLVVLSKWRMFAVRPRFWGANIRANAIDIIVGVSTVGAMAMTVNDWTRLSYAIAWAGWLILVKPRIGVLWVSIQAIIGQVVGLAALFSVWPHASLAWLVFAAGAICYFAAHHFFYSFDEEYSQFLSYVWAYFGAALVWILGHWLIFYSFLAQPTLVLSALGFGLGALYYLDHFDKLSKAIRRQIVIVLITIVIVVLVFSDWGDKIV